MNVQLEVYNHEGRQIADLGAYASVPNARQAMLDYAGASELPDEAPWFGPEVGVLEGWFIGRTEFNITTPRR